MGREITKFTLTAKHPVKYRFTCEKCGQDSGWQECVFKCTEEVQADGWGVSLSDQTQSELYTRASRKLDSEINDVKKKAENNKYDSRLLDKCPHCKKRQSWGIGTVWQDCLAISVVPAVILAAIFWLFSAFKNSWAWYVICGVFAISFIPSFIYASVRSISAAKVKNKQIPVIDWNGR